MRSILICLLCASILPACDKETPPDPPATPPAEEPAAAPKEAEATPPTNEGIDTAAASAALQKRVEKSMAEARDTEKGKQLRSDFITHLKAGRKLVKAKDYKAGLVELEKARALDPNDARILSEIGFAAMLADDLDTARKANLDSVRFAREDNLKAASLYNLGRIAEKESQPELAASYYKESLELRPNDTVEKRLAALGGKPEDKPVEFEPCTLQSYPGKSKAEVCQEVSRVDYMASKTICDKANDFGASASLEKKSFDASAAGFDKIELIHFYYEEDDMTEIFHLGVLDKKGTWHTTPLYWVYNPGAFGIMEDLAQPVVTFEDLRGDGSTQAVIRVGHHRHDSDMGIAEIESEDTTALIVIGQKEDGSPELLANFTDSYKYLREKLDFGEDEEPFDSDYGTKGLPIEDKFDVAASFDKKGNIVLGKSGSKGGLVAGTYALGAPELRRCSLSNGF